MATYTWVGRTNNLWSTANNWDTGGAPATTAPPNTSDVVFPNGTPTNGCVCSATGVICATLLLDTGHAGTLRFTGTGADVEIGDVDIDGGVFELGDGVTFYVSSSLHWTAGTIYSAGRLGGSVVPTLKIGGTSSITGADRSIEAKLLVTSTGDLTITMTSASDFLTFGTGAPSLYGDLVNEGDVTITKGGLLQGTGNTASAIRNSGTFTVNPSTGNVISYLPFYNEGSAAAFVLAAGKTFQLDQIGDEGRSFYHENGTTTLGAGSLLNLKSSGSSAFTMVVEDGMVLVKGNVASPSLIARSGLEMAGGSLTFDTANSDGRLTLSDQDLWLRIGSDYAPRCHTTNGQNDRTTTKYITIETGTDPETQGAISAGITFIDNTDLTTSNAYKVLKSAPPTGSPSITGAFAPFNINISENGDPMAVSYATTGSERDCILTAS
jgi:hypothetical protein